MMVAFLMFPSYIILLTLFLLHVFVHVCVFMRVHVYIPQFEYRSQRTVQGSSLSSHSEGSRDGTQVILVANTSAR